MSATTTDNRSEMVSRLSPTQQRILQEWLNTLAHGPTPEEKVELALFEAGLLSDLKPRHTRLHKENYVPVSIQGEPLSQTIIEERG